MVCFRVVSKSKGLARVGILSTAHGRVETPFFMPVATKGAVKNIIFPDLEKMGFDAIISNAFINYLKPGLDIIINAGGLHKFVGWDKTIFTDSGGFQLILDHFSPKITNKGVFLKNPFNKSRELISPEKSIIIQKLLGSDVAMVLDHQPLFGKSRFDYLDSTIRTIEWAQRCKLEFDKDQKNIQTKSIPQIKSGADLFIVSPKDSGKSTAVVIGIIIVVRITHFFTAITFSAKFLQKPHLLQNLSQVFHFSITPSNSLLSM